MSTFKQEDDSSTIQVEPQFNGTGLNGNLGLTALFGVNFARKSAAIADLPVILAANSDFLALFAVKLPIQRYYFVNLDIIEIWL